MSAFLIMAAILVAATLLLLLPPLLRQRAPDAEVSRTAINASIYRDQLAELERDFASGSLNQADVEASRAELSRRLLEDVGGGALSVGTEPARKSAMLIGFALPITAALLYITLGNIQALSPESAQPPKISAQQIEEVVAKLAARLEQNPDSDPKGWTMLARSYKAMGRYEEATRAFGMIEKLVNEDPNLLTDYAEALALSAGGSLQGRPSELVARALQLDPAFPHALLLAGTAAYEREDFAAAADYWERLLDQLPSDSEDAASLSASIEKARAAAQKQAGQKPASGK